MPSVLYVRSLPTLLLKLKIPGGSNATAILNKISFMSNRKILQNVNSYEQREMHPSGSFVMRSKVPARSISSSLTGTLLFRVAFWQVPWLKGGMIPTGVFTSRIVLSLSRWVESVEPRQSRDSHADDRILIERTLPACRPSFLPSFLPSFASPGFLPRSSTAEHPLPVVLST